MVKYLILVIIIASCDFLINPVGPISDLEANLFKYDVFLRSGWVRSRRSYTRTRGFLGILEDFKN